MTRLITRSPRETLSLGQRLGESASAGDVIALSGEMGSGKSVLARGIARGLGITGYVPSPTFTILQAHDSGRMPMYHFDWYRISGAEELYELSMEEYLTGDGVAVVEWPEAAFEALPDKRLDISLKALSENEREIALSPVGGYILPEGLKLI